MSTSPLLSFGDHVARDCNPWVNALVSHLGNLPTLVSFHMQVWCKTWLSMYASVVHVIQSCVAGKPSTVHSTDMSVPDSGCTAVSDTGAVGTRYWHVCTSSKKKHDIFGRTALHEPAADWIWIPDPRSARDQHTCQNSNPTSRIG